MSLDAWCPIGADWWLRIGAWAPRVGDGRRYATRISTSASMGGGGGAGAAAARGRGAAAAARTRPLCRADRPAAPRGTPASYSISASTRSATPTSAARGGGWPPSSPAVPVPCSATRARRCYWQLLSPFSLTAHDHDGRQGPTASGDHPPRLSTPPGRGHDARRNPDHDRRPHPARPRCRARRTSPRAGPGRGRVPPLCRLALSARADRAHPGRRGLAHLRRGARLRAPRSSGRPESPLEDRFRPLPRPSVGCERPELNARRSTSASEVIDGRLPLAARSGWSLELDGRAAHERQTQPSSRIAAATAGCWRPGCAGPGHLGAARIDAAMSSRPICGRSGSSVDRLRR